MKSLRDMQTEVSEWNHRKGWRDEPRTFGEGIALIHSEVSEALEAYRQWGTLDTTGLNHPDVKPEGVGSEFADILIRLLDECDRWGVDLEFEFDRKMAYNEQRPYRHGGKRL